MEDNCDQPEGDEHKQGNDIELKPSKVQDTTGVDVETRTGMDQLIANLGHELQDVRLRALKCLWRKIDYGLVSADDICRRTDFMNRLSPWIRTFPCSESEECEEGFELMIRMCHKLAGFEEFRKAFIYNHLDTVLSKRRLECGKDLRSAINQLLDKVGSFYIHCEGPADDTWTGNLCAPSRQNAETMYGDNLSYKSVDHDDFNFNYNYDAPYRDFLSTASKSDRQVAKKVSLPDWKKNKVYQLVGIKTVTLDSTDRRVLASTVESLSSKNESLVLMTCCFVRDVLLNDFPAEVFIQESAVSMSLIQVVQDSWSSEKVNYAAYQALMRLAHLLCIRIGLLNTSDLRLYEPGASTDFKGPQGYYGDAYEISATDLTTSGSTFFALNICKLLRMLSRSILYDSNRVTRWALLHSYVVAFLKCTKTYPSVLSKNIMMLVQEVLYDLKSSDTYASSYSTRPMAPFQPIDDEEILQSDFLLESLAYSYQTKIKDNAWDSTEKYILALLHDIQNSTGHKGVYDALNRMKEYCLAVVLKSSSSKHGNDARKGTSPRDGSSDLRALFMDTNWRDTFYRFLSVEPTSKEDEELLTRVLDLLCFVLTRLEQSEPLLAWITPLCCTKGCATMRILLQCSDLPEDAQGGTTLPSLTRTLLDFYEVIRSKKAVDNDRKDIYGSLLSVYAKILHDSADRLGSLPAVTFCLFREICFLTADENIKEFLQNNQQFTKGLLSRLNKSILAFSDKWDNQTFRNQGIVRCAAMSLLHVVAALKSAKSESSYDWVWECIEVVQFLWSVGDSETKAAGFQICATICSSKQGAETFISQIDPPASVWTISYREMINQLRAPVVQQAAALTLFNISKVWIELLPRLNCTDSIPLHSIDFVNDMLLLIGSVYWHDRLNRPRESIPESSKESRDSNEDYRSNYSSSPPLKSARESELSEFPAFVTPNILNLLCKLLMGILKTDQASEIEKDALRVALTNSGLGPLMLRLMENYQVLNSPDITEIQWIRTCSALSAVMETLVGMCTFDKSMAVALIGDKRNLSNIMNLLSLDPIPDSSKKCEECLTIAWINVFSLLTCLNLHAGKNFEDLERNMWNHWSKIFEKINLWMHTDAPLKCRNISVTFTNGFLSALCSQPDTWDEGSPHPVLCQSECEQTQQPYGRTWLTSMLNVWKDSLNSNERVNILRGMILLISISADAKKYANENKYCKVFSEKLKVLGTKVLEMSETNSKSKQADQLREEIMWILSIVNVLLYQSKIARETVLQSNFADNVHKIYKGWIVSADRNCLHVLLECLLNFTEEFARGSQSLTLTTNVIGVASRKSASSHPLLQEILAVLQQELDCVEKHPNLKTVDLSFSLLQNCSFSQECRALMAKSHLFNFMRRLHMNETKRWGPKQNHVKSKFLEFLVILTIYPDVQVLLPKINEATDILIALTTEPLPTAVTALQILRNLSFHPANRPRFLCNSGFIPMLASKLRTSESQDELECTVVTLWAITANSERGKLCAKQYSCCSYLQAAMQRILHLQNKSNDVSTEKQDFSTLLDLFQKVANQLGEN